MNKNYFQFAAEEMKKDPLLEYFSYELKGNF